jgi:hypothetical protein
MKSVGKRLLTALCLCFLGMSASYSEPQREHTGTAVLPQQLQQPLGRSVKVECQQVDSPEIRLGKDAKGFKTSLLGNANLADQDSTGCTFGAILGVATEAVNDHLTGIAGAAIMLLSGEIEVASTTTDGDGKYSLRDVPPGSYRLRLFLAEGVDAAIDADVTDGITTTVNFFHDPRTSRFVAFKPGVAIADTDPQLDVDGNGVVNLADLAVVKQCLGLSPDHPGCGFADVNNDGSIDDEDIQLIKADFERNIVHVPHLYGFVVSQGCAEANIEFSDGIRVVSHDGGLTELMVTADRENRRRIRAQVVSDRGSASAPFPLGDIRFSENSDNPSTATIDLDSGRLIAGRLTLLISGEGFENASVEGDIRLGQLLFTRDGFSGYYTFTRGTLSPGFPSQLALTSFSLTEGCGGKTTVACPATAECGVNFEGKACVLGSGQGACTTVLRRGGASRCQCK